jgi:4-amino-4-deoxy-L-arabinose transferase-like glycosyltransferase
MPSSSERATSPSSSATRRLKSRSRLDRWADTRWGGPTTALGAILGGAAAVRAVGIEYGLPYDNLLNPDEHNIVLRAWRMVHGGGADPHFFDYPTLLMYVEAPFQAWHDEPSLLTARIVALVLGLASIAATWWLARRAFGSATAGAVAAAVVAVCTVHVAYSREAVTDVPLTLGVAAALALMVSGRIELAGVAAGLATGFKYPGVLLAVPLVVAAWRQWGRLAVALVLMFAAFAAASPFVVAHPGAAWDDFSRVQRLAHKGWLGFEHDHATPIAFIDRLWEGVGPVLIVAAAGLAVALVRRGRTDLILGSFVVVYFLDLLTIRAHFDRYTLPLIPPLAALASRFRALAPVSLLLLVVPLTWSIRDAKELTRTDTRVVAARWVMRHIPQGTKVAADPSTPAFPHLDVLPLQLPGPGRHFDANRNVAALRRRGIEVVVVTGAVADRVLAARGRYPQDAAFYDALRRRARRLYYVAKGDDRGGPWVAVYRL